MVKSRLLLGAALAAFALGSTHAEAPKFYQQGSTTRNIAMPTLAVLSAAYKAVRAYARVQAAHEAANADRAMSDQDFQKLDTQIREKAPMILEVMAQMRTDFMDGLTLNEKAEVLDIATSWIGGIAGGVALWDLGARVLKKGHWEEKPAAPATTPAAKTATAAAATTPEATTPEATTPAA